MVDTLFDCKQSFLVSHNLCSQKSALSMASCTTRSPPQLSLCHSSSSPSTAAGQRPRPCHSHPRQYWKIELFFFFLNFPSFFLCSFSTANSTVLLATSKPGFVYPIARLRSMICHSREHISTALESGGGVLYINASDSLFCIWGCKAWMQLFPLCVAFSFFVFCLVSLSNAHFDLGERFSGICTPRKIGMLSVFQL